MWWAIFVTLVLVLFVGQVALAWYWFVKQFEKDEDAEHWDY
jgi:DNA-binding transcriptional regulator of glucitol operon